MDVRLSKSLERN